MTLKNKINTMRIPSIFYGPPSFGRTSVASPPVPHAGHLLSDQFNRVQPLLFGAKDHLESSIPVFDLSAFCSATNNETRRQLAETLGNALREYGFVAIKGHGIPLDDLKAYYQSVNHLLNRDERELLPFQIDEIGRAVGYNGATVKPEDATNGDNVTLSADPKHAWQTTPTQQLYPSWAPDFANHNTRMINDLGQVASKLTEVLGVYFGPEKGRLLLDYAGSFENRTDVLRAIHYPSLSDIAKAKVQTVDHNGKKLWLRGKGHVDFSLFTLLPQSSTAGLQLQKKDGTWMDVFTQEGYLIMNAGNSLAFMTEGLTDQDGESLEIPATLHRVVGDESEIATDRFSASYFVNGDLQRPLMNMQTEFPVVRGEEVYLSDGVPQVFSPALKMPFLRYRFSNKTKADMSFENYVTNIKNQSMFIEKFSRDKNLQVVH